MGGDSDDGVAETDIDAGESKSLPAESADTDDIRLKPLLLRLWRLLPRLWRLLLRLRRLLLLVALVGVLLLEVLELMCICRALSIRSTM